jgi:hypothetical protein
MKVRSVSTGSRKNCQGDVKKIIKLTWDIDFM